ncbi:hypothetical protein HDC94_000880 [Leifsonia sp. AK011]|uniref:hypothetical protein n=1 Tax=Leifsonia sp. AK011 TaxID=2723075 RepID=UPI0015C6AEB8|nr:hypothetical protein [Leifsonia sp. AK011]NYF09724.1 hypothetical protein [Leifsonia sp. AK011]
MTDSSRRPGGFFLLRPENPAEIGPETVINRATTPWSYDKLQVELDVFWERDPLIARDWVIATVDLERSFQSAGITGYRLRPVAITLSENYVELDGGPIPDFVWLDVTGKPRLDDIAWTTGGHLDLIVSPKFLDVLEAGGASHFDAFLLPD